MLETAWLDIRVLPWRPRPRRMKADDFREGMFQGNDMPVIDSDDVVSGIVLSLALWIVIFIAAPVIVIVLAVALFAVELPLVLLLAVLLVVIRFTGILPWTVVVANTVNGWEDTERFRNIFSAVGRIRSVNHDRRVRVRWAWW